MLVEDEVNSDVAFADDMEDAGTPEHATFTTGAGVAKEVMHINVVLADVSMCMTESHRRHWAMIVNERRDRKLVAGRMCSGCTDPER